MFAVVENATGVVFHLVDQEPIITEAGMISPRRAPDIRTALHSVVETDAPAERFLPGMMTLQAGEWAILDQTAYDALLSALSPPVILPDLTMRQFRLGLLNANLLSAVEAAIDALEEPERSAARIEFEYASVVVRTDPWVAALAVPLGLTDEQIDTLWTWAAAL